MHDEKIMPVEEMLRELDAWVKNRNYNFLNKNKNYKDFG